jgi:predicted GNAT family acetyltransferase
MTDAIRIRCACGWETAGPPDEAVDATQEHGRRLHNMEATREAVLAMAVPAAGSGDGPAEDVVVADNPDANRYEARLGDRVAAFSAYRRIGDRLVFLHTETDPAFEGRGVGSRLVREALDDVRRRDLRVTAKCPFVAAWLRRHPGYEDLIAG